MKNNILKQIKKNILFFLLFPTACSTPILDTEDFSINHTNSSTTHVLSHRNNTNITYWNGLRKPIEIEYQLDSLQVTPDSIFHLSISKYMPTAASGSVQGAACHGDYLFHFQDQNSAIYIYNLKEKRFESKINLKSNNKNHCNNVSFSNIFYEPNDLFPLLYVSGSSYGEYNHIQVYRISSDSLSFSISQVQEITLPESTSHNNLYWTEAMFDCKKQLLYVISNSPNGMGYLSIFQVPDIQKKLITLYNYNIIKQVCIPAFTHQQGACIYNNKLYIFDGVPAWGDTNYLRIIDLTTNRDEYYINLSDKGFKYEPEGAFFWQGDLFCITNHSCGIYQFKILDL